MTEMNPTLELTDEQIDKMEAGRGMDAVIGKVLGYKVIDDSVAPCYRMLSGVIDGKAQYSPFPLPNFSTDPSAALQLLDELNLQVDFSRYKEPDGAGNLFDVDIFIGQVEGEEYYGRFYDTGAPTLPLAICRAVLKWKVGEVR